MSLEDLDRAIIGWASDGLLTEPTDRVSHGWWLMDLRGLLMIIFMYFNLVGIGMVLKKSSDPEVKGDRSEKKKLTLSEKFQRDGFLMIFQSIYNIVQVGLMMWMIIQTVKEYRKQNYSLVCNSFDTKEKGMASIVWVFYLSKVLDFCDTVFIILKKSWRRLSFLHVYHHSSILFVYWVCMNAGYDGDIYYTVVLNAFIHFLMYGYYLATTLNVSVPTPIKKLVTNMQMIQFVSMNIQGGYALYNNCAFPHNLTKLYLGYIFSLLVLFNNFSKKTYTKQQKKTD